MGFFSQQHGELAKITRIHTGIIRWKCTFLEKGKIAETETDTDRQNACFVN